MIASVAHDEKPAPTYVSELRKIMQSKPDVMFALGYPGQATVYLKEFFEVGYNKTTDLFFCDGTKSVEMPKALGPENLACFIGTAPGTVAGISLSNFERDYKAMFGELPPLPYMTNFYDAIVVATLAAAACEAQKKPITGVNLRNNLRFVANPPDETITAGVDSLKKALKLLKGGKDINYEGAAGFVDFDKYGDVVTPIEVWKYVEAEPYIETVKSETEIPEK